MAIPLFPLTRGRKTGRKTNHSRVYSLENISQSGSIGINHHTHLTDSVAFVWSPKIDFAMTLANETLLIHICFRFTVELLLQMCIALSSMKWSLPFRTYLRHLQVNS